MTFLIRRRRLYWSAALIPWEALAGIKDFILELGPQLPEEDYDHPAAEIWIAKSAKIAPTASLNGPLIIGP